MRLFKQKESGGWFVFWSLDDGQTYTAIDPRTMHHLAGTNPQELIRQLLAPTVEPVTAKVAGRRHK